MENFFSGEVKKVSYFTTEITFTMHKEQMFIVFWEH